MARVFYRPENPSYHEKTNNVRSLKETQEHWFQPEKFVHRHHPFIIRHWNLTRTGTAPFTPALQCQYTSNKKKPALTRVHRPTQTSVFLTRDYDLKTFDPKVNGFWGLIVEHLHVKVDDPSCIDFWDTVHKKQTYRQTAVTTRPPSQLQSV